MQHVKTSYSVHRKPASLQLRAEMRNGLASLVTTRNQRPIAPTLERSSREKANGSIEMEIRAVTQGQKDHIIGVV